MNRVEARGIGKRYGNVRALEAVDLTVDAGSIVCVLGASGSGKSTVLRLLHLLEAPDEGDVLVDGASPRGRRGPRPDTLRRFGMVQQAPGLLRMRIWQNVAFPLRARGVPAGRAKEEAFDWLHQMGLEGRRQAYPSELSGGEVQRVALARALSTRPDFLLVDEGTNHLDPFGVRRVEAALRAEAARGCGVVLVTHNVPQALRMADRFVFLDAGRVVEAGGRDGLREPQTQAFRFFLETGA